MGLSRDFRLIEERLGWGRFLQLQENTYKGLTLEFFSTLDITQQTGNFEEGAYIQFHLGGIKRKLLFSELNTMFEFEAASFPDDPYTESKCRFVENDLWRKITSHHELAYIPGKSKAAVITHPSTRVHTWRGL